MKSVDSNPVAQTAVITFDDTKTNVKAIQEALKQAGYPPLDQYQYIK